MTIKRIVGYFLIWRLLLFAVVIFAIPILPLQTNFLGGGLTNYLDKPYFWSWANFDGEHYLSIAEKGYSALQYFFFPVFPILVRQVNNIWGLGGLGSYVSSGLLVSHMAFLIGLIGLVRLIRIDNDELVARTSVLLLLLFPTSFYFGALYTESLFFALVVWTFYFARMHNWLAAGILAGVATATRITGIALLPALFAEYFLSPRRVIDFNPAILNKGPRALMKDFLKILIAPLGIIIYMFYLFVATGDHLAFFHDLNTVYGEQRSSHLVVLPQVFYRYFFKLLPNINYDYFPVVITTYLETIIGTGFLFLCVLVILKRRLSEGIYALFAYLIPTLSGSFSSFPRYALIIFPVFILCASYLNSFPNIAKYAIYWVLFILLTICSAMFTRGYWVS